MLILFNGHLIHPALGLFIWPILTMLIFIGVALLVKKIMEK